MALAPSTTVYNPVTKTAEFTAPAAPEKPEASPADVKAYEYARNQGYTGSFMDFKAAQRPPAAPREPAAPTITQIQDPTNPNQMITINARVYQGGGVGSPGVIGTTGKTPAATAAAVKQEQGQSQAQDIIDNLRGAYTRLNDLKAIPSTQRGVLSNVLSSIAASAPGQIAGRAAGTEEQTQRDIIQSARNQLFAAVKNATGLSAQNLNSNVEFTTWLNSLTDPSKSYQTNEKILDELEKFIASGGKYSAKPKPADGGKPTPSKPGSGVDTNNPLLK